MSDDQSEFAEELRLFQEQIEKHDMKEPGPDPVPGQDQDQPDIHGEAEKEPAPDPETEPGPKELFQLQSSVSGEKAKEAPADSRPQLQSEADPSGLPGEARRRGAEAGNLGEAQEMLLNAGSSEELEAALQAGLNLKESAAAAAPGLNLREELSQQSKIEALLFASPKPLKISELQEFLSDESGTPEMREVLSAVESLMSFYREKGGGFQLEHQKGAGYQFQTVPAASALMETMFSQRPRPLSRAAHETLAIVAYRQPVTRADIEFIRGVDAGSIIKNLLDRDLVTCVGRKENSPGKPMLFGTTAEFLRVYRLSSVSDLPPLEAFQPAQDTISKALDKIEAKQDVDVEELITQAGDDRSESQNAPGAG